MLLGFHVLFLSFGLSISISCPPQFSHVGDGCYFLSTQYSTLPSANRTCLRMHSWLVAIETAEENRNLFQWLQRNYTWGEWFLGPYLGLYRYSRDRRDTTFLWMNPSSRSSTYSNWDEGAPDIVAGTDNCVTMTDTGNWYNYYCDTALQFICESFPVTTSPTIKPSHSPTSSPSHYPSPPPSSSPTSYPTSYPTSSPTYPPTSRPTSPPTNGKGSSHPPHERASSSPTPSPSHCPQGYEQVGVYCYNFMSSPLPFTDANETCHQLSGSLVSVGSEDEADSLYLWLQSLADISWVEGPSEGPYIGLCRDAESTDLSSRSFHWSTSPSEAISFTQWTLNYPLFASGLENCVLLTSEDGWRNADCSSSRQYICESSLLHVEASGDSAALSDSSVVLFVLLPMTLFAGGVLFFLCGGKKYQSLTMFRRQPGVDVTDEDTESVASTHALVDRAERDIAHLKTRLELDDPSPEETMEIQLHMRSYSPLVSSKG